MLTLVLFVFGILFSIIALNYLLIPYILIAVCWFLLFIALTLRAKDTVKKSIWFNLAFAAFLFGMIEVYSYFSGIPDENTRAYTHEGGYTKEYFTSNEILGYGPFKNNIITSKKFFKKQLIYDVTYTIGNDGLRITPPTKSISEDSCILFFGGSVTFGEGVDDQDSMPFVVGTLQNDKVYNFGFHGYGPHQMLAAIENKLIDCKPQSVIYQAITTHVARSAGYSSWDKHGPKYIWRNGQLTYGGRFDSQEEDNSYIKNKITSFKKKIVEQLKKLPFFNKETILAQLKKSYLYNKFLFRQDKYTLTDYDIQVFLEIVNASRTKLAEKFPGVDFNVILWDNDPNDPTYLKIKEGFKTLSIHYHLVSNILPGLSENIEKYELSVYDKHPNPKTHKLIAEYVVKNIIAANNLDLFNGEK